MHVFHEMLKEEDFFQGFKIISALWFQGHNFEGKKEDKIPSHATHNCVIGP